WEPVQHPGDALDVVLPGDTRARAVDLNHPSTLAEGFRLIAHHLEQELALGVGVIVGGDLAELCRSLGWSPNQRQHLLAAVLPRAPGKLLLQLHDVPSAVALRMAVGEAVLRVYCEVVVIP